MKLLTALTQVFTANDYVQGSQDFVYEKSVPYTTAVKGAEVSKVTLDSSAPAYFGIKKIDGNSRVLITVKKKALAEADAANAAASRKPKSLYKATSTVKATVEYTTGLTETISFKLTTPEKPQTYAEALAVIKAAEKDALAVMTYTNNDFKEDIEADIAAKANALISKDSGASVTVKTVGDIKKAEEKADGYVNAKLTVTNTESGATEKPYESVARQWAVKMTKTDITTLKQAATEVSRESGITPFTAIPAGAGNESAIWVYPDRVCTVEYMPNTKNSLRQAVFKGFRTDMVPEDID